MVEAYELRSLQVVGDTATVEAMVTINSAAGETRFPITQRLVLEEEGWRVVMRDEQIERFTGVS